MNRIFLRIATIEWIVIAMVYSVWHGSYGRRQEDLVSIPVTGWLFYRFVVRERNKAHQAGQRLVRPKIAVHAGVLLIAAVPPLRVSATYAGDGVVSGVLGDSDAIKFDGWRGAQHYLRILAGEQQFGGATVETRCPVKFPQRLSAVATLPQHSL